MPASGEAISDSSVDKSLEASNSLSNPPLTPPSYSGTDTDLQIRRSCACPLHRNPEPSSPSPAAAARRPTDTQPRGPFAGMVFGVLPEQWDLEVLSIVQRMIVLGGGKIRRPDSSIDCPPQLLLLPLVYEQRDPRIPVASSLPEGWEALKPVISPWVASCHMLGHTLATDQPVMLGVDPSILSLTDPHAAGSAFAMKLEPPRAGLEEMHAPAHSIRSIENDTLHEVSETARREKVEQDPVPVTEELKKDLASLIRTELEQQRPKVVADPLAEQDISELHDEILNVRRAVDRVHLAVKMLSTAGTRSPTDPAEDVERRPSYLADQTVESPEASTAALTAMASGVTIENKRYLLARPTSDTEAAVFSVRRLFPLPTHPKRQDPTEDNFARPAKRRKTHPFWSRIFG